MASPDPSIDPHYPTPAPPVPPSSAPFSALKLGTWPAWDYCQAVWRAYLRDTCSNLARRGESHLLPAPNLHRHICHHPPSNSLHQPCSFTSNCTLLNTITTALLLFLARHSLDISAPYQQACARPLPSQAKPPDRRPLPPRSSVLVLGPRPRIAAAAVSSLITPPPPTTLLRCSSPVQFTSPSPNHNHEG